MDKKEARQLLQDNLDFLKSLPVSDYLIYRKWIELNNIYATNGIKLPFLQDEITIPSEEREVKNNIWIPTTYNDYLDINPKVIYVDTDKKNRIWTILRLFCIRLPWSSNPGRLLKFLVIDKTSGKYLGLFSLGSDFLNAGGRDKYIGWLNEDKLFYKMLNHLAMGSTIVATQPLGHDYLGGKLISLLVCSDIVEKIWNNKYDHELVGITTTSLYGGFSQYNSLKYWKKCESSEGKISLEPSDDIYLLLRDWLKKNEPELYDNATSTKEGKIINSHPKSKILDSICRVLNIDLPYNNAPRGVYFCSLYDNTRNFLCRKENLNSKRFDNNTEELVSLWKEKYAKKRIKKLVKEDRVSNSILFYDNLIDKKWGDLKEEYLKKE